MARLILVLAGIALVSASCSGAQHRKVTGPPPEYEQPELSDAATPVNPVRTPVRDAGSQ